MSKHSHDKDSHFIPSPYKTVTSYENAFIKSWSESVAESIGDVLKYVAKIAASELKELKN